MWQEEQRAQIRAAPGVVIREDTWSRPADCLSRRPGLMGPGASLTSAVQTHRQPGGESQVTSIFTRSPPTQAGAASARAVPAQVFGGYCCVSGKLPFPFLFKHVQHT